VPQSEFVDKTSLPEVTVMVKDNVYSPQYITVSPGTKVVFNNVGRNPHNVIPVQKGAFEQIATDDLQPDEQAQVIFDAPGMYPYFCSLHGTPKAGMNGRVQVAES
jgi:plastocyanin